MFKRRSNTPKECQTCILNGQGYVLCEKPETFPERLKRFIHNYEAAFVAIDLIGLLLFAWLLGILPLSHANASLPELFPQIETAVGSEMDYYRNSLSEREQVVYDQLESGYRSLAKVIYPKEHVSEEEMEKIRAFVLYDNPDIFWADGQVYAVSNPWGVSAATLVYIEEDQDKITEQRRVFDERATDAAQFATSRVDEAIADGTTNPAERQKALAHETMEWLVTNCEYGDEVNVAQNIDSVFGDNMSVCAGYSKAYKYILDKMGVPCVFVVGATTSEKDSNHAWNMANVDGHVIYIDVTWGDKGDDSNINWMWFDTDPNMFATDHMETYSENLSGIWGRVDPSSQIGDLVKLSIDIKTE